MLLKQNDSKLKSTTMKVKSTTQIQARINAGEDEQTCTVLTTQECNAFRKASSAGPGLTSCFVTNLHEDSLSCSVHLTLCLSWKSVEQAILADIAQLSLKFLQS